MKITAKMKPSEVLAHFPNACEVAVEWAKRYKTAKAAWEACERPDWLLWILNAAGKRDPVKDRLFACWCARNTPLHDGRTTWDLLTDQRSRTAVEVAERFAHGEATEKERAAAWAAAWDTAWDAAWDTAWAATGDAARDAARAATRDAAWAAARAATRAATWDAAWAAAWAAARAAAWDAARAAAWAAARAAARAAQANALREIYSSPFSRKAAK